MATRRESTVCCKRAPPRTWIGQNPAGGLTPLLIATMNGRAACVVSLLRAGATIIAAGEEGCAALRRFAEHRIAFQVSEELFRSRNYKVCLVHLSKAHRSDDRGVPACHPGGGTWHWSVRASSSSSSIWGATGLKLSPLYGDGVFISGHNIYTHHIYACTCTCRETADVKLAHIYGNSP